MLLRTALSLAKNARNRAEYPIPSRSIRYLCCQCSPKGTASANRWSRRKPSHPPGLYSKQPTSLVNATSIKSLLSCLIGTSAYVKSSVPGGSAKTTVQLALPWYEDMRRNLEGYRLKFDEYCDGDSCSPVSLVRSDMTWWRATSTSRCTSPENLVRLLVPRLFKVIYLLGSRSDRIKSISIQGGS